MLSALEAAGAVAASINPIVGDVAAVAGAVSVTIKLLIWLLPYMKEGAICIKNGTVFITHEITPEAIKAIEWIHKEL